MATLGQARYNPAVRVNVGQAKTDLSRLLARVEAGEDVEIARGGVPVVRLVRIEPETKPGEKFRAIKGALAGQIFLSEDFEFGEEELDRMYAEWDEEDKLLS